MNSNSNDSNTNNQREILPWPAKFRCYSHYLGWSLLNSRSLVSTFRYLSPKLPRLSSPLELAIIVGAFSGKPLS